MAQGFQRWHAKRFAIIASQEKPDKAKTSWRKLEAKQAEMQGEVELLTPAQTAAAAREAEAQRLHRQIEYWKKQVVD